MSRENLSGLLADYRRRHPAEADVVARFETLLQAEPRCFERDCWTPGHITGSAWLVDRTGSRVLLTHHRKLDRWLQLGGHADGDDDGLRVAVREAEEESGLAVAPIAAELFDIDVHAIPARGRDPGHLHFDLRFALGVLGSEAFRVGDESHDLCWVEIEGLDAFTDEPSMLRMRDKWRYHRR